MLLFLSVIPQWELGKEERHLNGCKMGTENQEKYPYSKSGHKRACEYTTDKPTRVPLAKAQPPGF